MKTCEEILRDLHCFQENVLFLCPSHDKGETVHSFLPAFDQDWMGEIPFRFSESFVLAFSSSSFSVSAAL